MPSPDALDAALHSHRAGRLAEAERAYRAVLRREPDHVEAIHLLGMLCHQTGRNDAALDLLRRSVERSPSTAHFRSNLAAVLGRLGRPAEAVVHLREVVRLQPRFPQGHNNLGVALESLDRLDEASAALREALRLKGDYAEAHNNLGNVLRKRGPVAEAVACYRAALALRPDYPEAHGNLAAALGELGRTEDALSHHQRVMSLRPDWPQAHSDYLFALHYLHGDDPQRMLQEHVRWAERHARPLYPPSPPDRNGSAAGRRIRVGYVSPDFRAHPVSRFFEPLLEHHDRARFEVFCYSDAVRPDAVTLRLRGLSGTTWRETVGMPDASLADLVRREGIDVLVDLTGHMAANRLLVFARRSAPVQVSFLGYPNTTGVRTIDYRITDSLHDPPGATEPFHTERLVRLDPCCWCYRPDGESPGVNDLPARTSGRVTFACLNKLIKGPHERPRHVRLPQQADQSHATDVVSLGANPPRGPGLAPPGPGGGRRRRRALAPGVVRPQRRAARPRRVRRPPPARGLPAPLSSDRRRARHLPL
jgi:predicted O-linked N-acetylglucosamine transferase (SPINDLY family)